MIETFDVVIVGAGPAGCACAYMLSGKGIRVALVDKESFPRDKICGDALSADVINQLYRMNTSLAKQFESFSEKQFSQGVRFYAPNQNHIDIEYKGSAYSDVAGYVSKRVDFDHFFFNEVKDKEGIYVFQKEKVLDIIVDDVGVEIETGTQKLKAKLIVGADGVNSIVNKLLAKRKWEKDQCAAGLRQYYENVTGFHENNHIELHFYKDILPGYFWIFPMANNRANIGLGIFADSAQVKQINIKEKLQEIIKTHPKVKDRFKEATPLESIKGFRLPLGIKKNSISGNRYLLLGDAAALIDPFSGEGIGNAIRSGRLAAEHIVAAITQNKFDSTFNKKYDKIIYQKMWNELRVGHSLQKLLKYPRLFNMVVNKARKNESFRLLLTSMLDNIDLKKELLKPSFYVKLLFN